MAWILALGLEKDNYLNVSDGVYIAVSSRCQISCRSVIYYRVTLRNWFILASIIIDVHLLRLFYHSHKNTSLMITKTLHSTQAGGKRGNKWMNRAEDKPANAGNPWFFYTPTAALIQQSRKKPWGGQSHSIRGLWWESRAVWGCACTHARMRCQAFQGSSSLCQIDTASHETQTPEMHIKSKLI